MPDRKRISTASHVQMRSNLLFRFFLRSPQEHQNVWNGSEEVEGVVAISDDFGDAPGEQGEWQTSRNATSWRGQDDTANDHHTGQNLHGGDEQVALDDPNGHVNDL
jgi:hypothetical protein